MNTLIHTGRMIKQHIDDQRMNRSLIARHMLVPGSSIYAYEKRSSIQTKNLLQLCTALQHNFFQDIANQLPATYTQSVASPQQEQLRQLAEEIKILQQENKLLKELLMGKKD